MSEKRLAKRPPLPRGKRFLLILAIVVAVLAVTAAVLFALYRGWARRPALPPDRPRPTHQATQPAGEVPVDSDRKEGWFTFLVIGTDKVGANTDTIMVVACDTINRTLSVMNIPRDTMVNVSWDIKKINSVYATQGIDALREQLGQLIGFLPDYYITIDWEAFGRLVDEIGGVTFNVPINMYYDDPAQNLHIRQPKGERLLSGADAMQVVRFRINNDNTGYIMGDIDRITTQQALLTAIVKKCFRITNIPKIPAFMEIFNENVGSDLDLGNMVWFAEQMIRMDTENNLHFFTLPGNYSATAYSRTYRQMESYVIPKPEELVEQINLHLNPYIQPVEVADLDLMSVDSAGKIHASSGNLADTKANNVVPQRSSTPAPSPSQQPSPKPSPSAEPTPSPEPEGEGTGQARNDEGAPPPTQGPEPEPSPTPEPDPEPPPSPAPTEPSQIGLLPPMPTPAP